eukprot:5105401-Amphidinium_carterae.1
MELRGKFGFTEISLGMLPLKWWVDWDPTGRTETQDPGSMSHQGSESDSRLCPKRLNTANALHESSRMPRPRQDYPEHNKRGLGWS